MQVERKRQEWWGRVAGALLLSVLCGTSAAWAQDKPAAPDCEGRNPLYCGTGTPVTDENGVVTMPPGGCEGRNPAFCRELEAKAPDRSGAVDERRRVRRSGASNNPNANPNRNRRSKPAGDGGSPASAGGAGSGS